MRWSWCPQRRPGSFVHPEKLEATIRNQERQQVAADAFRPCRRCRLFHLACKQSVVRQERRPQNLPPQFPCVAAHPLATAESKKGMEDSAQFGPRVRKRLEQDHPSRYSDTSSRFAQTHPLWRTL